MRKWLFLSTSFFLGFGSIALATPISTGTQPNVRQPLIQLAAAEQSCGGSCYPIQNCTVHNQGGPACRVGQRGVWVITCINPNRCHKICYDYCP